MNKCANRYPTVVFQVMQILGIKPDDLFTLNSQTNIITFKNGSLIFLMDMSHQPSDPLYTRFGGLELTGAFVDESNENNVMAIEILKTRLGRGRNKEYGLIPKLLETFNPSKNHVYTRYYKPWKDGKLPAHRIFITALATDNTYLDDSYIEQLKNADKVTRERLLYGNFEYDDDPAKLFEYDKICDIFSTERVDKPRRQNYLTCDVARMGRDKTVIMIWLGLHIHKVFSYPKTTTTKVRDLILENCRKYKIPHSNVMIDEDGVGGGVYVGALAVASATAAWAVRSASKLTARSSLAVTALLRSAWAVCALATAIVLAASA